MSGKETIFGLHAVSSVLERSPDQVIGLWVQANRKDRRLDEVRRQADKAGVRVQAIPRAELDERAPGGRHQGVVAEVRGQAMRSEKELPALLEAIDGPAFLLVLDGVQDPHNLGACLRSADAAGVHAVIVPKDRSAGLTATVRKVACGAAETVPLLAVTNLARTLRALQDAGVWLFGAAGEAEKSIYDMDLKGPAALVMGNEGSGLRRLTRETCDHMVNLPMAGTVDSLNVSVAAGVCLFEAGRQRRHAD